ncbi:MAG TPA: hypothetical protein VFN95_17180, partial [Flavitalea sp.]|nr:hypothetical protein [Flavitalea sp.]
MKEITKPAVILLSLALALYITAFTAYATKSVMVSANRFDSKKESIVSCGPSSSTRSGTFLNSGGRGEEWNNGHESSNTTQGTKNNERNKGTKNNERNSCSHQQLSGFLCEVSG